MSAVLLCPGQGSQQTNMRELVELHRPDLHELAIEAVGCDPFERIHDGTAFLQPAIYCASLASREAMPPLEADAYAGHSLGELTALAIAGALNDEDGLRLVATRGRLMQQAAEAGSSGAMLAVAGGLAVAAAVADEFGLSVANDNSPDQVVLSGAEEAVVAARAAVKSRGQRAFRLPIKGAFHSPAMAAAVPEFRAALDAVEVRPARAPVFSCVTAAPFDDVRARLADSLTCGVRWREVLLGLRARGARRFVEVGPGHVLTGLVRDTLDGVEAMAVSELEPARA
ncbi:MAG TPA: ACP S-malonyltransferase [Thermoleophilaceae bacterium]